MKRLKKYAFTLAEVLITLGIIGVVSAMTIPSLVQKQREQETIAKLRVAQSVLTNAVKNAEVEYGDVETWGFTTTSGKDATIIAEKLKPFFKIAVDCGLNDPQGNCIPNSMYKQLNGNNHSNYATQRGDTYKITLLNGSSVWWKGKQDDLRIITFWVDVNGKYPPNTYGKDLFVFAYENGGIRPLGAPDSDSPADSSCKKTSNGWGCAYYVLQKGNMNYLH